jgi:hypothetical protein
MNKTTKRLISLAALFLGPLALNSCTVGSVTGPATVQKMPEPARGMLMDLQRSELAMYERCSAGSAKLVLATATIAEGCGLEKESQKLRAHAQSLVKTSSSEDHRKFVIKGEKLIAESTKKMASSTGAKLASDAKFKQGYQDKIIAEKVLNQVASKEIPVAVLKAGALIAHCKDNKEGLKSNPLAALQMGMAINYSLLPIRFVANDYKEFRNQSELFDQQCQQIGKKYNIALPAPVRTTPISIPEGVL